MSYVPESVNAQFTTLENRKDYSMVQDLRYPVDRNKIRGLSLAEMQVWYASQDPHTLIESGSDFHTFWYWHYIVPLKFKRLVFRLKFW